MTPGWALVTGGAKRLGRAVAERLAAAGWGVAIHYNSSAQEAEALAASLPKACAIAAELSDPANAATLAARAAEACGAPLTALVNSASIFEHDDWRTVSPAQFHRAMNVNALAPALLTQSFAQALPEGARGVVVNFLDFKLAQPYPDHFSYTLSKYALQGAQELFARALAPRIRVNAVAPGYILPAPGQAREDFERLHAQNPLGRGATADDIASAAFLLIDNEALTGQTIYVDAGLRLKSHERDFAFL